MPYPETARLSPNRAGGPNERLGVVFHHSEMAFQDTVEKMLRPESEVSYHCLIDAGGGRCTLVPDGQIAWHAGKSTFLGRSRCNDFMLGVAFAGDTAAAALTEDQLASALEWLRPRWRAYGWDASRMTDHRQVSPGRRRDLDPDQWLRLLGAIEAEFGRTQAPASFTG